VRRSATSNGNMMEHVHPIEDQSVWQGGQQAATSVETR